MLRQSVLGACHVAVGSYLSGGTPTPLILRPTSPTATVAVACAVALEGSRSDDAAESDAAGAAGLCDAGAGGERRGAGEIRRRRETVAALSSSPSSSSELFGGVGSLLDSLKASAHLDELLSRRRAAVLQAALEHETRDGGRGGGAGGAPSASHGEELPEIRGVFSLPEQAELELERLAAQAVGMDGWGGGGASSMPATEQLTMAMAELASELQRLLATVHEWCSHALAEQHDLGWECSLVFSIELSRRLSSWRRNTRRSRSATRRCAAAGGGARGRAEVPVPARHGCPPLRRPLRGRPHLAQLEGGADRVRCRLTRAAECLEMLRWRSAPRRTTCRSASRRRVRRHQPGGRVAREDGRHRGAPLRLPALARGGERCACSRASHACGGDREGPSSRKMARPRARGATERARPQGEGTGKWRERPTSWTT